jgi:membrane protein implicated in regulation of membrane protease activity
LRSGKLFWPILSRVFLSLTCGLVAMYLVGVGLDHFNRPHFPGEAWAALLFALFVAVLALYLIFRCVSSIVRYYKSEGNIR